jgi:hypothetical protein
VSEIAVIDGSGKLVAKTPHFDAFLSGWKPDSTDLVCYRDGEYFLASVNGKDLRKARLPGATNVIGTERVSYLPRAGMMIWSQQDGFHTVLETRAACSRNMTLAGSICCSVTRRKICRDHRWFSEARTP